jgi:hypothetical protein
MQPEAAMGSSTLISLYPAVSVNVDDYANREVLTMGTWRLSSSETLSPGATIRSAYQFPGVVSGIPAIGTPRGPVHALVSPIGDPLVESNWVGVVAQGFKLYGGQYPQDAGCVYTVDITCQDSEGTDDDAIFELWVQSFY